MRKLIVFLISIFYALTPSWSDDKISSQHEAGLQITGYYSYDEPHFMYNRSYLGDHLLDNFGLVYNFKQQRIIDDYLYEFEVDTDYKRIDFDYWSNSTGTIGDVKNEIFNLRLLGGIQLTDNVKLKSGYGYRYLEDHKDGLTSTTGATGYDRIQEYQYIPLLAEIKAPAGSLDGTLKLEYDYIYYGKNESKLSSGTVKFRNDDGYMVKASYKFPYLGYNIEPYYIFQSVEESDVVSGFQEPSNTTNEYGLKITKVFGDDLAITDGFKTPIGGSTDIYFGTGMMFTKIDTGFHSPTGTTNIDEKDIGYKLFAGLPVKDNLDLELAYNNFGDSVTSGNNGDTFVDGDGKYSNGAYSPGTTLSFSANNTAVNIRSNSTSASLKPKIKKGDFEIIPMIGIHRWDQSETTVTIGTSSSAVDYSGTDIIYGIGLKSTPQNNFTVSLNYAEYPMYYDASAMELNLEYKF